MQAQKQLNQHPLTSQQSAARIRVVDERTAQPSGSKPLGMGRRRLSSANIKKKNTRRNPKNLVSDERYPYSGSFGPTNKNSYQQIQGLVNPYMENVQ